MKFLKRLFAYLDKHFIGRKCPKYDACHQCPYYINGHDYWGCSLDKPH